LADVPLASWKAHLEQLRRLPASKFNAAEGERYVAARWATGAEAPTRNRELSIIRRGFTLAKQSEPPLVHRVPYIPKLEEDEVRQGFPEPEQYEKVLVNCLSASGRHSSAHTTWEPGRASCERFSGRRSISMPGSST
jgi:hypothetical protein